MKTNDPVLRAMYIILVPVVALIILLNTGLLQKHLTAATVGGEKYTVVQYNYYYFEYYNSFLEENEDSLAELGYDPERKDGEQQYDANTTWKEFFMAQAEAMMAETMYYYGLAQKAGYSFSEEELAPIESRLDENEAKRVAYGISSAENYYISYYGSGMNVEQYTAELTRQVKAQAYKNYLTETHRPTDAEIAAWLEANGVTEYDAAQVRVITLEAVPDRETGEVGEIQLNALEERLARLVERYENGVPFETLQSAFSSCSMGDKTGAAIAIAGQAPEQMIQWCNEMPDSGSTLAILDDHTAYFVIFDCYTGSGAQMEAKNALSQAAMEEETLRIRSECSVVHSTLGMMLATA